MGQTDRAVAYREAFDSATIQFDHLVEEMDRLKDRQDAVERAARALEPVLAYGAAHRHEPNSHVPTTADTNQSTSPDGHQDHNQSDGAPHSYVHGQGDPQEEMDRRISFALGRTAAD
jgi:hypothetical protein